nr:acyclic terpene utilization AtuA family protein [uncultured Fusobacterium sp.]
MKKIRIASGAGYAGDRIEPAIDVMKNGNIDYIAFECLAERTIAIAQAEKLKNPDKGYNNLLEDRFNEILPICKEKNIKIITNMGAANPIAAIKKIKEIALNKNIKGLKLAAVIGDDISDKLDKYKENKILEFDKKVFDISESIVSANVYLGAEGIVEALENKADIIVTGRCSDPSLFLAPLMYEFGWNKNDKDMIAKGIMIGHLLECGAQVSGGYYSTPTRDEVEDLWNVGFPIAEVSENGDVIITKTNTTSGKVTTDTCKEQLIYEIHNPKEYMTPDGIADFTTISLKEIEKNKVFLTGATGKEKPATLKVSMGYKDCFIAEAAISYGGSLAFEKAKEAKKVIEKRLEARKISFEEIRFDFIGFNSLYENSISNKIRKSNDYSEVRLRVAARTKTRDLAKKIVDEVETLYTNGPSGGGGVSKAIEEVVSICSIFVPREDINVDVVYEEV